MNRLELDSAKVLMWAQLHRMRLTGRYSVRWKNGPARLSQPSRVPQRSLIPLEDPTSTLDTKLSPTTLAICVVSYVTLDVSVILEM